MTIKLEQCSSVWWFVSTRKVRLNTASGKVLSSTSLDEIEWRDCCSCNLLQYTDMGKCYLFVLYNKNSNGLLKDFLGMKKKLNKSADVI